MLFSAGHVYSLTELESHCLLTQWFPAKAIPMLPIIEQCLCVRCFSRWSQILTSTFEIGIILISHMRRMETQEDLRDLLTHVCTFVLDDGFHTKFGYSPCQAHSKLWQRKLKQWLTRNGDLFDRSVLTALLVLLTGSFWRLPDCICCIPGWFQV